MGLGRRIALGTWIVGVLLCGIASAVIAASTPTRVSTVGDTDERPDVRGGGDLRGPTLTTQRPLGTVPPFGGPVPDAGASASTIDATREVAPPATEAGSLADAELAGGVHLELPGTWVIAADGSRGALLATADAGSALDWAGPDVLARPTTDGIAVVGVDGTQWSHSLGDGRRVLAAGVGGGRVVFAWDRPTGGFGTSIAALDLSGEQVLVPGENATTIAVSPRGDVFVVAAGAAGTFTPDGTRRGGPVAVGAMVFGATWDPIGLWVGVHAGNGFELLSGDLAHRRPVDTGGRTVTAAALAPGGEAIAFAASVGPSSDTGLFVATAAGPPRLLAEVSGAPAWHPDGSRIAFTRHAWPERGRYAGDVRVVDPDGGGAARLASLAEGLRVDNLRWSPDGAWLAMDVHQT